MSGEKEFHDEDLRIVRSTFHYSDEQRYIPCLEIKNSWINGGEFQGLFTTSLIPVNSLVCKYYGDKLNTLEAIKRTNKAYLMRLGNQSYVDALDTHDCLAR